MRGRGGGRVYFFAAGARRVFFLLWVRGRFAHSLAAEAGLGNPIGHGLRIGACAGPGGGAFIFLLRVRGAFFFLLWVRPGLGRSGGMQWGVGRPAGGRVYFFAAGARRVFFFCCGCAAGSLTHLLPAASEHPLQKGIQGPWRVFFFAAGARALGGRVYFFAAGARRVYFFAAGALTHSLTHSLPAARRAPTAKKHTQQKKTRVPTLNRNPKTPALLIIPKP